MGKRTYSDYYDFQTIEIDLFLLYDTSFDQYYQETPPDVLRSLLLFYISNNLLLLSVSLVIYLNHFLLILKKYLCLLLSNLSKLNR